MSAERYKPDRIDKFLYITKLRFIFFSDVLQVLVKAKSKCNVFFFLNVWRGIVIEMRV